MDNFKLGIKKKEISSLNLTNTSKICFYILRAPPHPPRPAGTIHQQTNHVNNNMWNKKKVQMKTFHILAYGCLMIGYSQMEDLYNELRVPNMLKKHWTEWSGWYLVKNMYNQVIHTTISLHLHDSSTLFALQVCFSIEKTFLYYITSFILFEIFLTIFFLKCILNSKVVPLVRKGGNFFLFGFNLITT